MKDAHPSLLDVILTDRPSLLFYTTNFTCGISDWHNMISCVIKGAAPPPNKRKSKCRSYKHFDEKDFSEAVGVIPFDVLMFLMTWMTSTGLMKSSSPMF